MKKYLLAYLLVLIFASCKEETPTSEIGSLDEKEWFIALKSTCDDEAACKLRINKAMYQDDTVYYSSYVGALCDIYFEVSLLTVNGETIKSYSGPDELEAFNNEVEFVETIYSCEDN